MVREELRPLRIIEPPVRFDCDEPFQFRATLLGLPCGHLSVGIGNKCTIRLSAFSLNEKAVDLQWSTDDDVSS
jgi:hypothetical protein